MNNQKNSNQRILYIDVLRVISMLSVVFMHTAAGSLRGNIGSLTWHVSNILTAIMCTSVPVFFMISGAMVLDSEKTASIHYMYKKRFPKVFIPFFVWSMVAIVYHFFMKYAFYGVMDKTIITGKLKNILSQATTVHLWFMYALIPLYILSPILKKLVDSMTKNIVIYMFALWLLFSSVIPTVATFVPDRYRPLVTLNQEYNLNFIGGYLGYFILGYYLFKMTKRISKKFLALIIVLDVILISVGTWYMTMKLGPYPEHFLSYPKVFMLILSVSVFLLVKELLMDKTIPNIIINIISFFASISFGIYLVHNLFVDYISNFIPLWPADSLYDLLLCYVIVLLASIVCIVLLASCKLTCFIFAGLPYKTACRTCNIQFFLGSFWKLVNKQDASKENH